MMNKDVVYFPKAKILEAAKKFETPFFLYDEKRLRDNCQRFKQIFIRYFPTFQPLYAVKANANPHVLRIVIEEGFKFDASSECEAFLAKKLKAGGMYTGNYTLEQEFRRAKAAGLILNLDDISMVPTIQKIGTPATLSFRVNPGVGQGGMKSLILAGTDAKYGVPFERAPEAYEEARAIGVKKFGIHMMTGSNVLEENYFVSAVEKLLDIAGQVKQKTGIQISFLNIGGGFGVPYRPEQKSLGLNQVAQGIRKAFDRKCRQYGLREPQLLAEPGRYIAADMGWLIGRVHVIKDGYKKFVGIDASSNDMPRPSIYDAYHHITVLNASKKKETVSIVGRICENSDQFGKDRLLPICRVGDIVAIHNCGAHAYAMGHNYNGHPRHAEYLLKIDGTFKQIRRAERIQDLLRTIT